MHQVLLHVAPCIVTCAPGIVTRAPCIVTRAPGIIIRAADKGRGCKYLFCLLNE